MVALYTRLVLVAMTVADPTRAFEVPPAVATTSADANELLTFADFGHLAEWLLQPHKDFESDASSPYRLAEESGYFEISGGDFDITFPDAQSLEAIRRAVASINHQLQFLLLLCAIAVAFASCRPHRVVETTVISEGEPILKKEGAQPLQVAERVV